MTRRPWVTPKLYPVSADNPVVEVMRLAEIDGLPVALARDLWWSEHDIAPTPGAAEYPGSRYVPFANYRSAHVNALGLTALVNGIPVSELLHKMYALRRRLAKVQQEVRQLVYKDGYRRPWRCDIEDSPDMVAFDVCEVCYRYHRHGLRCPRCGPLDKTPNRP